MSKDRRWLFPVTGWPKQHLQPQAPSSDGPAGGSYSVIFLLILASTEQVCISVCLIVTLYGYREKLNEWKEKNICSYVGFFSIFWTLFSNQFHYNCLNTLFFHIGSKVKGLTGLSNILIPFSCTAISLIDNLSGFISISNSYITHINWWVCMNPQGQYFIFAPFAQSLNFSENGRLCRCKCVCYVYYMKVW